MELDLQKLKKQALNEINQVKNSQEWNDIQKKYFSRKSGELAKLLKDLKDVSEDLKPKLGALANEVKQEINQALQEKQQELEQKDLKVEQDFIDVTLDIDKFKLGHLHPMTKINNELEDIFSSMGFMILDGPELESDYYNFEALNIPSWHPARDMQDTFFIQSETTKTLKDKLVLRTHTSPVQVRAMQKYGAPFRGVVPGRCFRNEATDASHDHTFNQLEGLMIGENISISNLISVMKELLQGVFKREVTVRLRPGYFPFVEPGFELDIKCLICEGQGCSVCKQTGWVELLPCGMVHPNVLKYGKIDHKKYNGFAFGLGTTRLVMMKYGIDDIRLLQGGDMRFLNQF